MKLHLVFTLKIKVLQNDGRRTIYSNVKGTLWRYFMEPFSQKKMFHGIVEQLVSLDIKKEKGMKIHYVFYSIEPL